MSRSTVLALTRTPPARTPAARPLGAALVGALLVGIPLVANIACATVRYTESFAPEGPVQRVVVRSDAGRVEIAHGDSLRVERAIRAPEAALELSHEVVDGTLFLEARCASLLPCAVDTRVSLPTALPVEIDLGEGDVAVSGVTDLSLEVDEGQADVEIRGDLVATVGSGSLRLRMDEDGTARVGVGSGDIEVEVPVGPWRVDARTDRLRLEGLQPVTDAPGSLELTAPAGSVIVRATANVASR